jgi:hypothetical protein
MFLLFLLYLLTLYFIILSSQMHLFCLGQIYSSKLCYIFGVSGCNTNHEAVVTNHVSNILKLRMDELRP